MSEQPIHDIFKALNERDVPTMMAWVKHPHVCTTSVERNVILLLGADLLSLRSAYEELRQAVVTLLDMMPSFPAYDLRREAVDTVRAALASSSTAGPRSRW